METNANLRYDAKFELEKFVPVITKNFSGLENPNYKGISKNLEKEILNFFQSTNPGNGESLTEQIYAKNLHNREKMRIPPVRFTNNLLLYELSTRGYMIRVPEPIALLYQGDLTNIFKGRTLPIAYLSQKINGKNLLQSYKNLEPKEIKPLIRQLSVILNSLQEKGFCLLDFAPRDIVLPEKALHPYYLVDNENMALLNLDKSNLEEGIKLQINEFKKEYSSFPNFPELMQLFKENLRG